VQARDLLVEVLRQDVDVLLVRRRVLPELDLRDDLVGERGAHHEARVAGGAAEVHEAARGEQRDALAVLEDVLVDLGLDVDLRDLLVVLEPRDLDLAIEVADVAEDRLVLHRLHVLGADDALAARGGDDDVGEGRRRLHRDDLVAFHRGLEGADGVDLGDHDARAERAKRLGRALAHVAVARDDRGLAGEHHVGRALDAVAERLAAAVQVVELRLGDRVVDVDRGDGELALLRHLVERLHARRRLLADAADRVRTLEHLRVILVDDGGQIATVVEDHVRRLAVLERLELLVDAPLVLFLGLALPGEDGDAGDRDGGGGVVLRREDVARRPGDLGAERREGLDQDRGLDRHVQTADHARALERLLLGVLLAERHQAGHLLLGDRHLLATPLGELDVGNLVIRGRGHGGSSSRVS
jgi:hypothetical protein